MKVATFQVSSQSRPSHSRTQTQHSRKDSTNLLNMKE